MIRDKDINLDALTLLLTMSPINTNYMSKTILPIVDLPNGKNAINMSPESTQQLAIVNLSVIQRLAKLLPKANFNDIRAEVIFNMRKIDEDSETSLAQLIQLMEDEVAFHRSVNLIAEYNKSVEEPQTVGQIA